MSTALTVRMLWCVPYREFGDYDDDRRVQCSAYGYYGIYLAVSTVFTVRILWRVPHGEYGACRTASTVCGERAVGSLFRPLDEESVQHRPLHE